MENTFMTIMSVGGLIVSCLAGVRLYELGEEPFFYGFILGVGTLMFVAKYIKEG